MEALERCLGLTSGGSAGSLVEFRYCFCCAAPLINPEA